VAAGGQIRSRSRRDDLRNPAFGITRDARWLLAYWQAGFIAVRPHFASSRTSCQALRYHASLVVRDASRAIAADGDDHAALSR
jgi:hypothetical protein